MRIRNQQNKGLNKYESKREREKQLERIYHGEGLYVYRNRTNGDLRLPKPTPKGEKTIAPGKEWEGDNYYMRLVPQEATVVRTIMTPKQEKENQMNEQKLILDQPDTVTRNGQVEHVTKTTPTQPLNETPDVGQQDVLLTEDPMDGVQILRD